MCKIARADTDSSPSLSPSYIIPCASGGIEGKDMDVIVVVVVKEDEEETLEFKSDRILYLTSRVCYYSSFILLVGRVQRSQKPRKKKGEEGERTEPN